MTKKTDEESRAKKFPISLQKELFDFLVSEANSRYGGNRSAAIADFLRDAQERDKGPFGPENALIADAKQAIRRLGLKVERDDNGVDWVIPELGLGLELKARLGTGGEQRILTSMAYSLGKGRCSEFFIVGGAALTEPECARLKMLAESFKMARARFITIAELPDALKRLQSERRKRID